MGRLNKGVVRQDEDGLWYGRVRWTDDETGKERDKKFPPVKTKTEADKLVEDFKGDLKTQGGKVVDAAKVKFEQLAKTYKEKKLFPAKIVNGRKVGGLKSLSTVLSALNSLRNHFDKRRIKGITHSDIESYKLKRLDAPIVRGKGEHKTKTQRSIASVNRELELLRAMFRFSVRQGWLTRSPFEMGDPLISKADETRRERVLSLDEERRLIEAFQKPDKHGRQRRLHMIPLLYCALDTACRRGELFKLRWKDVDFAARTFTVVAENSKTARARTVGLTPRVFDAFMELWNKSPKDANGLVFGITNTVKTAFKSACEDAGIVDYRWHDGRHTATTRMVDTGRPSAVIMKITGHTQHSTFARYVNPNVEAITGIADALAALNSLKPAPVTQDETETASAMVN